MIRATDEGVTLAVRAQPGAKKTAITGIYGDGPAAQLKIAVQSPPIEGRANQALVEFLANLFSLSCRDVVLLTGDTNRTKVFLLRGATVSDVQRRIGTIAQ